MNSFFLGIKIIRLYKEGALPKLDDRTITQWQAILLRALKRNTFSPKIKASPDQIRDVWTNAFRIVSAERALRTPEVSPYKTANSAVAVSEE